MMTNSNNGTFIHSRPKPPTTETKLLAVHIITMAVSLVMLIVWITYVESRAIDNTRLIESLREQIELARAEEVDLHRVQIELLERIEDAIAKDDE